jgi:hypothetical protein
MFHWNGSCSTDFLTAMEWTPAGVKRLKPIGTLRATDNLGTISFAEGLKGLLNTAGWVKCSLSAASR